MPRRGKPDFYADLAKKEGYPARSIYKLKEIHEKFHLFRKGDKILDIGAAPGSWSMFAYKLVGKNGTVLGVDLNEVNLGGSYASYACILGDAFAPEVRKQLSGAGPYNVVMSDAAPKTTGNRIVDTARSSELVFSVISLATEVLLPGGKLVIKVFQGGDEREILDLLRPHFPLTKFFKPKASRNESFETFVVATGFNSR